MKYSEEEKIRVVKMCRELGSVQKAVRNLGYPKTRNMVYNWMEEYERTGGVKDRRNVRECRVYSEEEKRAAIDFYYSYGKGYKETVSKLGYPSYSQLKIWIAEDKEGKIACQNVEKAVKAAPLKDCASDAQSDCTKMAQAY